MKSLIFVSILVAIYAKEYTIENCRCWDDYKPVQRKNEEVFCEGIVLDSWLPCDRPRPPKCECGDGVTGILRNKTGTWCSTHVRGKLRNAWPCENQEDWTLFKLELEEYKKSLYES